MPNIRLVQKWMALANTPAYYDTELITIVNSLIVKVPSLTPKFYIKTILCVLEANILA